MEKSGQQGQDRGSSASKTTLPLHAGDGPSLDNGINKSGKQKNERIVSSVDTRSASRSQTHVISSNNYTAPAPEQTYYYGGYNDGSINSNYGHANNLQIISPAIYSDYSSLLFNPAGYGFDPYGQLSPIMLDGQLYAPSYYPQTLSPTPTSTSNQENVYFDPGLGYYVHYPGSNQSTPGANQSTPGGILGPYEHRFGQNHQQQTPYQGYGFLSGSSTKHYPQSGSYQVNHRDPFSLTGDSHATTSDRNRGPRASKPKGTSSTSTSTDLYNTPDFVTSYENAKFFVIKSFSEDNVHRSIKHGVWASTPLGNRKLDATYQQAKESGDNCRIFLFFSVNASGQFCGVAEMIGPVDFENDAEYWQQDRWSGQFRVKWHIIKDVPNSRFRHILLENNDNKPVTHSRDSQEVKLEEGIAMLKIFKEHDSSTSIMDDFSFYDEREKSFQEKRAKEGVFSAKNNIDDDSSINQLSDRVADSLHLEKHK